jgi:hypothetical protein
MLAVRCHAHRVVFHLRPRGCTRIHLDWHVRRPPVWSRAAALPSCEPTCWRSSPAAPRSRLAWPAPCSPWSAICQPGSPKGPPGPQRVDLTGREPDVLRCIVHGRTYQQTADDLPAALVIEKTAEPAATSRVQAPVNDRVTAAAAF